MKPAERECFKGLRRTQRIQGSILAFQVVVLALNTYSATKPGNVLGWWSLPIWLLLAAITVFQFWHWTSGRARLRVYKCVLRLADEAREAEGGLRLHKFEQMEAAFEHANRGGQWLAFKSGTQHEKEENKD